MKYKLRILSVAAFFAILFAFAPTLAGTLSALNGQFNVTPDVIYVNWTGNSGTYYNATFNITVNDSFIGTNLISIFNSSSNIRNSTGGTADFLVTTTNLITNTYNLTNQSSMSAGATNYTNISFALNNLLAAGRYNGTVNISNATNGTFGVSLVITLDVPVNITTASLGGSGVFSGNVTNSTNQVYFFNASSVGNVSGLRINMSNFTSGLTVGLYDSTGTLMNSTNTASGNLTYVFNTFPAPNAYWFINVSNGTTLSDITFSGSTVELLKSSLRVNTTANTNGTIDSNTLDSLQNITADVNLNYSGTISRVFSINNTAGYDLDVVNAINATNLTNGIFYIPYNINTKNGSVFANTADNSTINFVINTSETNDTIGFYRSYYLINTTNGYPYSMFNLTLFVNLTRALNVSSVIDGSNVTTWPTSGGWILVNVTPRWLNGTYIGSLNNSSFQVWAQHVNYSSLSNTSQKNVSFTMNNFIEDSTNSRYTVNASSPSYALGGNYTLTAYVTDTNTSSCGRNCGFGDNTSLTINDSAIKLDMVNTDGVLISDATVTNITLSHGSSYSFKIRGTNYGAKNVTLVNIARTLSGSCLSKLDSISGTDVVVSNHLNPWGGTNNSNTLQYNGSTVGSCTLTINGSAVGTKWDAQNITINFNVTSTSSSATTGSETGVGTNTTITRTIDIITYPTTVSLKQGASTTATIRVKNIGTLAVNNIVVSVGGIERSWWSVSPSTNVSMYKNENKTWTITFKVPASASATDYSITFNATGTGATSSKTATLKVQPSSENQVSISDELDAANERYDNVSAMIDAAEETGKDVTAAREKLAEAQALLDDAQAAADSGDWNAVSGLLEEIDAALTNAEASLSESIAKEIVSVSPLQIGSAIAVIAVIVAAIYFVKFKRAGYYPGSGYVHPNKELFKIGDKISSIIDKIKKLLKRNRRSYQSSSYAAYSASP